MKKNTILTAIISTLIICALFLSGACKKKDAATLEAEKYQAKKQGAVTKLIAAFSPFYAEVGEKSFNFYSEKKYTSIVNGVNEEGKIEGMEVEDSVQAIFDTKSGYFTIQDMYEPIELDILDIEELDGDNFKLIGTIRSAEDYIVFSVIDENAISIEFNKESSYADYSGKYILGK